MNHTLTQDRLPRRLPADALVSPQDFVTDFFEEYDLDNCRNRLNNLVKDVMSSEVSDGWDSRERSNFVFFIERIEALIAANFLVSQKNAGQ